MQYYFNTIVGTMIMVFQLNYLKIITCHPPFLGIILWWEIMWNYIKSLILFQTNFLFLVIHILVKDETTRWKLIDGFQFPSFVVIIIEGCFRHFSAFSAVEKSIYIKRFFPSSTNKDIWLFFCVFLLVYWCFGKQISNKKEQNWIILSRSEDFSFWWLIDFSSKWCLKITCNNMQKRIKLWAVCENGFDLKRSDCGKVSPAFGKSIEFCNFLLCIHNFKWK